MLMADDVVEEMYQITHIWFDKTWVSKTADSKLNDITSTKYNDCLTRLLVRIWVYFRVLGQNPVGF
jgi:hypothetical protein